MTTPSRGYGVLLATALAVGCSDGDARDVSSRAAGARDAAKDGSEPWTWDDGGGSPVDAGTPTCSRIRDVCAPFDPGTGAVHECRRLGEARVEAACLSGLSGCEQSCGSTACLDLGSLCHNVDKGTGPINECHSLGHARVATTCFARGAECFSLCSAALAAQGTGGAASGADAGGPGATGGSGGSGGGGPTNDASPDAVVPSADAAPERG